MPEMRYFGKKGKARAAYWRKKNKIVPPPLTPSRSLPHSMRLFGLRRQLTLSYRVKPSPASFAAI